MRPCVSYLSAAVFAGMLALLAPLQAKAGPAVDQTILALAPLSQSTGLVQVGYYGGGDYERDEKRYDDDGYDGGHGGGDHYGSEHKHDYDDSGHKDGCCDYQSGSGYGHGEDHYRKRYPDYHDGCCNDGCYKKKWVCEASVPRCFKQRECVWYYGKEYCRYVHRCVGGGDNYCKWVSVHSHDCGGGY